MNENQIPPTRPIPPRPVMPNQMPQAPKMEEKTQQTKSGKREPLSDQSKSILFGLLGAFALLGGIACLIVMLVI